MKQLLLLVIILILVFSFSCSLDYKTWSLESDPFKYPDSSPVMNTYPLYTFEYPDSFIEIPSFRSIRPPYNIRIVKNYFGIDDPAVFLQPAMIPLPDTNNDEYLEWMDSIFEIYISEEYDNQFLRYVLMESKHTSDNESVQIMQNDFISVDSITANITTVRYFVSNQISNVDPWRIISHTGFKYDGYSWHILMYAPSEKLDIMMEYYTHLLETFKILE